MPSFDCNSTSNLFSFFKSSEVLPLLLAYVIGTNLATLNFAVTQNIINPFLSLCLGNNNLEQKYIILRNGKAHPYANLNEVVADHDAIVAVYGKVVSAILSLVIVLLFVYFAFKVGCFFSKKQ